MNVINTYSSGQSGQDAELLVAWNENLSVGIEMIDKQHKHLLALTNNLYEACRQGGEQSYAAFKETMSRIVEYVRFHFSAEQALLQRVQYPNYAEHKKEHDQLILNVLEYTKESGDRNRFVPNQFVRFLRDWIVGHVAHSDKMYSRFIFDQLKKGIITEAVING